MNGLIEPLLSVKSFNTLLNTVSAGNTPVLSTGVLQTQKCHLIAAMKARLSRPVFIITANELKAKSIYEDLRFFVKDKAMLYPAKDIVFYSADVHSAEIMKKRFEVISRLTAGEDIVIVASAQALLDRLMKKELFIPFISQYKEGQTVSIDDTVKRLTKAGYERVDMIEGCGQFSRRGGILDIFPISSEKPVRVEFWDNEIDSVRTFDIMSQRSLERITSFTVVPRTEIIEMQGFDFKRDTETLLNYLQKETILFFDEPHRIKEHVSGVIKEFTETVVNMMEKGRLHSLNGDMIFSYDDIIAQSETFDTCLFVNLPHEISGFNIKNTVDFNVKSPQSFKNRIELLAESLNSYKQNSYRTAVLGGSRMRCERLIRELAEHGVEAYFTEEIYEGEFLQGKVVVTAGSLHNGFEYADGRFVVISDQELFGAVKKAKKPKKKQQTSIESFTDLRAGDLVVHQSHGIGIFKGIEQTVIEGVTKDFIKIEYADGGMIGVSVNQLDMIQKFIGQDGNAPKLNKLGGQDWHKAKAKAKASVKVLAAELTRLYAARQALKGFTFSEDTLWQTEFEETFEFEETTDQLSAIEDVKKDMQSDKAMDRLICGDVGYGKTEIAIRAAFKCAQDGKQVAYLVPTTILAQQHYNTFAERMKDYPVVVEMMTRFKTSIQQKKIREGLKKGFIDIIISTHRIISKDIEFKDLGLVIIDEEQRFGVSQKEKLKSLKENVDVLTLTATPIPRTLHMSMTGIRDLSLLEEPPHERKTIQTYVLEYDDELIRAAINRELSRNGQVYYLHNRVRSIAEVATRLQKSIPEARISYAHGQMEGRELEKIMISFINGETDVLVCTTIIETGLDIPNVNTIIIRDADRMGLSQLYQLRGRVGRSNRTAYAYLCYKRDKALNETAEKRLQTIKEFTEFGSGFKIAMRDLEIRGAGNLLGAEQHGHMASVGYEMYCRLLAEAVREERGEVIAEPFETAVDINIDAFIPNRYIENETQRLAVYKKIAQIESDDDYFDVQEEIEDRYGNIPREIQNLLEVAALKACVHSMDVLSVIEKSGCLIIAFKDNAKIEPNAISVFISRYKGIVFFTAGPNPYLTIKLNKLNAKDKTGELSYIKNMLQQLKDLNFKLPSIIM